MDYRKLYENYYNVKLSSSWDIHHIDFNHSNNDICNLVALPKELHHKLHTSYDEYLKSIQNYSLTDIRLYSGRCSSHTYFMEQLTNYLNVLAECVPFMNNIDLRRASL